MGAGEIREARAKAARTNSAYISIADRLLEQEPEVFAGDNAHSRFCD